MLRPMPRVLICQDCQTIETLPNWTGDPKLEANDPLLDGLVRRHVQKHGDENNNAMLLNIEDKFWDDDTYRESLLRQLKERWTGFHPEFYATKDTYQEDAAKCFSQHSRPKEGCIDWEDSSKRLTPETWPKNHVFLCHFCPVAAYVTTAKRMARGMYNREPGEID